ncbi:MAG: tRNA 5-methoxyuridine(34)/uridine 5-oxyacetic acid(34) synthase CmoB [Gammaproteobacteria bacterium]
MDQRETALDGADLHYLDAVRGLGRRELGSGAARAWLDEVLDRVVADGLRDRRMPAWRAALRGLPALSVSAIDMRDAVRLSAAPAQERAGAAALRASLADLQPWRKGPFDLFGLELDAEWRADLKWQRVLPHLSSLVGRSVLDVGCGNGYYAWRMLGAGARWVLGLDPGLLQLMQFRAVHRYVRGARAGVLPLGSAALDRDLAAFDTVFSMGVLYHRREPLAHLLELRRALRPGGELVLETLIVRGSEALIPVDRYARMPNVTIVPSIALVEQWLTQSGFADVRCVDVCRTTAAEQRSTAWMRFESLQDCLDPTDASRTVEQYPAPTRAVFIAAAA